jgi:exopolysaccharide production protein ExoZ
MLVSPSIVSLQYLRGIAAMMVVYFHATRTVFHHQNIDAANSAFGSSGVDIFFVISGFIMYYTTAELPI